MLIEAFVEADITVLSANTDGVVIRYKKDRQHEIDEIHDWWEKTTGLTLEDTFYEKIIMGSVNSYMAILSNGYVKYKGEYEVDKQLHKDHSSLIIPKALSAYYKDNIPVEETIRSCKDIYDFCISSRMKSNQSAIKLEKVGDNVLEIPLGRTNRYYASKDGYKLIKCFDDGRRQELLANRRVTLFNTYEAKEMEDYNIDYSYYISECNKRIEAVNPSQLSLF